MPCLVVLPSYLPGIPVFVCKQFPSLQSVSVKCIQRLLRSCVGGISNLLGARATTRESKAEKGCRDPLEEDKKRKG